jgi:hypothetical protein
MLLPRFDPPGFLNDFNDTQKAAWSKFISDRLDAEMAAAAALGHHFYNPTKKDTANDVQTLEISWTAFPHIVEVNTPSDRLRWQTADGSRNVQDEYCEWSVTRDPAPPHKITRVTFTCEGPEYWSFLARTNPTKVLSLYQQFISPQVKMPDLFVSNGQYRPQNKWNNSTTRGAMHLIQGANTLGAELNIAVRSSIIRQINGTVLMGEQVLIECGQYGDPERHSDPHIGELINDLARQHDDITIANPVALYIKGLATSGWSTPDGSDPRQYWTIVRGDANHAVRAVYEVPKAKNFTVSDITINGVPIDFGAQIADFITIKIVGQACRLGQNQTPPVTQCVGAAPFAAVAHVEEALAHPAVNRHR